MTRRGTYEVTTTFSQEFDLPSAGYFELWADLCIEFSYSAPGPSGGTWNSWIGSWDPPDTEEIEIISVEMRAGKSWWPAPRWLQEWADEWITSEAAVIEIDAAMAEGA